MSVARPRGFVALYGEVVIAPDWDRLGVLLDEAQTAYEAGTMTREQVEAIASGCIRRSKDVPEHGDD